MSSQAGKRPRRRRNILVEGDVDAADAVTFKKVTTTTRSGKQKTTTVKVALLPEESQPAQTPPPGPSHHEVDYTLNDVDMPDAEPIADPKQRKVRVWIDLILQMLLMSLIRPKRTT